MTSTRPPLGCAAFALAAGSLWLGASAFWCVMFYRQESAKADYNAAITSHLSSVQGKLVDATSGGDSMKAEYYYLTYRYTVPDGRMRESRVTIPANQLGTLALNDHEATLLSGNPRPWTVEYDERDPSVSRLRGLAYQGGTSPGTKWGGLAVGVVIGVVGFLFLTFGILRGMVRR